MNNSNLWESILQSLEKVIDKNMVNTWLRPAKIASLSAEELALSVPNKFYKDWIDKNYLHHMTELLREEYSIEARISTSYDKADKKQPAPAASPQPSAPRVQQFEENFTALDVNLTFENFVNVESNGFAHSAALAVSDGNFSVYNPLFIYGGTGLGKTHLMYAIANRIKEKFPKMSILYMDSDTFSNEVIQTLRKGDPNLVQDRIETLRNRFRAIDLFMLDDIQFLKKREKTLEIFFNIFNDLHIRQKQIVLTSDESPQEIDMAERMRSRFAAGFQAEIQPPGVEERVAILMQKAGELSIILDEAVAYFIAENVNTKSIRDLIGALKRVNLYASFYNSELTVEIVEKALGDSKQLKKKSIISPQQLISAVADTYNVKLSDLVSKKRSQSIVHPRQVAMYLMRERLNLSLKEIGEQFKRDHSTVKYAVDSINNQMKSDDMLRDLIGRISAKIFR